MTHDMKVNNYSDILEGAVNLIKKDLETAIHGYIDFYNHDWIKTELKGMSPVE